MTDNAIPPQTLSRPIVTVGFLIGLLLSFIALSGDQQGRVNLLFLLMIYLVIPIVGAVVSVVSLVTRKGFNIARITSAMPVWPAAHSRQMRFLQQTHIDKPWFFMQSQAAALAYSVASLFALLILLLTTDVNFVWRSTLLTAQQVLPLLETIALPWAFWEFAQPTEQMLRLTQDSRIAPSGSDVTSFGQWWGFVVATQIVYGFGLRIVLMIGGLAYLKARWLALRATENAITKHASKNKIHFSNADKTPALAKITHHLPDKYVVVNWANIDMKTLSGLEFSDSKHLQINKGKFDEAIQIADKCNHAQVILVKAWEPPLAELQDFMHHGHGVIVPINYQANKLQPVSPTHLEEWQRFTGQLPQWQIYQPRV